MDVPIKTISRRGGEEEGEEHHQNPFISTTIAQSSTSKLQFRKEASRARWDEDLGMGEVVEKKGSMWATTGIIRAGRLYCHIEEILFLAERGALLLSGHDGTILSFKDIYIKIAQGAGQSSWESFVVYRHLKSLGYVVGRHGIPWTTRSNLICCNSESLRCTYVSPNAVEDEAMPMIGQFQDMQINEVKPTLTPSPLSPISVTGAASKTLIATAMVRAYTQEHVYHHPWDRVTAASWRKFTDPGTPAVLSHVVDVHTLSRRLDPTAGKLHTTRSVTVRSPTLPFLLRRILGHDAVVVHCVEDSIVDGRARSMQIVARNASLRGFIEVVEKSTYDPHPEHPDRWTVFRQETSIRCKPLSALAAVAEKVEQRCAERFLQNSAKGREVVERICKYLEDEATARAAC